MTQSSFETRLRSLSEDIAKLRAIHGEQCKIPEATWSAAVTLCKESRVSIVASALKLGQSSLYQKMRSTTVLPRRRGQSSRSRFMKVALAMTTPPSNQANELQIELARKDGGVMRIKDPKAHGAFLSVLIQSFMAHGAGQAT